MIKISKVATVLFLLVFFLGVFATSKPFQEETVLIEEKSNLLHILSPEYIGKINDHHVIKDDLIDSFYFVSEDGLIFKYLSISTSGSVDGYVKDNKLYFYIYRDHQGYVVEGNNISKLDINVNDFKEELKNSSNDVSITTSLLSEIVVHMDQDINVKTMSVQYTLIRVALVIYIVLNINLIHYGSMKHLQETDKYLSIFYNYKNKRLIHKILILVSLLLIYISYFITIVLLILVALDLNYYKIRNSYNLEMKHDDT